MSRLHPSSLNNFLHSHLVFISNYPFPAMCFSTSCIHLVSYVSFPPWLLHNFLCFKFILFQYPNLSCTPCASQQLPAVICFQYLGAPCPCTTSSPHLVLTSNFPRMCLSSNFLSSLHSLGFNISAILTRKCSATLLVTHRVSPLIPILPSSSIFNFYSSHLFRPFTYAGESAPL